MLKINVNFYLLSVVMCALIISANLVSCGVLGGEEDGESEPGTYELVDGFSMEEVILSNDPIPQPDNHPEAPVIENIYWDDASGSEEVEIVVETKSRYPIKSIHIQFEEGNHIVIPTDAYFDEPISFDFCEAYAQISGVQCTASCVALSSNFKLCNGSANSVSGMSDTEFVRQWFAASCSQELAFGNIGPNGLYNSEYEYYWEFWLGNDPLVDHPLYTLAGFTCQTAGESPSGGGEQAETFRRVGFSDIPQMDFSQFSNNAIQVSAQSEKPTRSGSEVLTGGNTEGAQISCFPNHSGMAVPGGC